MACLYLATCSVASNGDRSNVVAKFGISGSDIPHQRIAAHCKHNPAGRHLDMRLRARIVSSSHVEVKAVEAAAKRILLHSHVGGFARLNGSSEWLYRPFVFESEVARSILFWLCAAATSELSPRRAFGWQCALDESAAFALQPDGSDLCRLSVDEYLDNHERSFVRRGHL